MIRWDGRSAPGAGSGMSGQGTVSVAPRRGARGAAREARSARRESARIESARIESARMESARMESARIESARMEAARIESVRIESARIESAIACWRAESEKAPHPVRGSMVTSMMPSDRQESCTESGSVEVGAPPPGTGPRSRGPEWNLSPRGSGEHPQFDSAVAVLRCGGGFPGEPLAGAVSPRRHLLQWNAFPDQVAPDGIGPKLGEMLGLRRGPVAMGGDLHPDARLGAERRRQ